MPIRMAFIKRRSDNKCWGMFGKMGAFTHCWWEQIGITIVEKQYGSFSKKLKIELQYYLVILLLAIYIQRK